MVALDLQFYTFGVMILTGISLGLAFDVYRVIRGLARPRKLLTLVGDLLFWLFATALAGAGLLVGNWGEFRLYVFVGLFIGLLVYYWLASALIVTFLAWTLWFLGRAFKYGVRISWMAVAVPIGMAWQAIALALGLLGRGLTFPTRLATSLLSIPGRWMKRRARAIGATAVRRIMTIWPWRPPPAE